MMGISTQGPSCVLSGSASALHPGGDLGSRRIYLVSAAEGLLPSWMPWIRKRHRMTSPMEKQLLGISARQIERKAARENGFELLEFKVPRILWRRTNKERLDQKHRV